MGSAAAYPRGHGTGSLPSLRKKGGIILDEIDKEIEEERECLLTESYEQWQARMMVEAERDLKARGERGEELLAELEKLAYVIRIPHGIIFYAPKYHPERCWREPGGYEDYGGFGAVERNAEGQLVVVRGREYAATYHDPEIGTHKEIADIIRNLRYWYRPLWLETIYGIVPEELYHTYRLLGEGHVEEIGNGVALYMFRKGFSFDDWVNLYNSYIQINEWRRSYHRHIDEEGGKGYGASFLQKEGK